MSLPARSEAAAPSGPARPALSREDFDLLRKLVRRETGISLSDGKEALVTARLGPRLRALGLGSFRDYCRRLEEEPESGERVHLFDCIVTGETHFFREPQQFRFLAERVLPQWREEARRGGRSRAVRVWSAGCSTGEEPFSLAMFLSDHLPAAGGWRWDMLATDLSSRALAQAHAAIWPLERAREIPPPYRRAHMLRGVRSQSGRMRARPGLRALVRFERLNLHDDTYPDLGVFDLIFCRNVLIYFDAEARRRVIDRFLHALAPTGLLLLGNAENLGDWTDRLRSLHTSVYARVAPATGKA